MNYIYRIERIILHTKIFKINFLSLTFFNSVFIKFEDPNDTINYGTFDNTLINAKKYEYLVYMVGIQLTTMLI